ncbi:hypothetical protein [Tissierella praeacuta]|uniref:hypothetical protein n=1 Tax=Tissierella praeacuta TaxID=43131 RepID=UPI003342B164
MTDRELLELIAAQVGTLTKDVSEMKEEFKGVNERLDKIENKLDDIDVKNADRHLDFIRELKGMKHSVSRIEINTAENWRDIARLKAMRKYKTK